MDAAIALAAELLSITCSDLSLRWRAKSRIEAWKSQKSSGIDLIYTLYTTELYQYYCVRVRSYCSREEFRRDP
jgi:hypothetical protein